MPIRKTKRGYKIDKTPGYSKTKTAATKRLRANQGKATQIQKMTLRRLGFMG